MPAIRETDRQKTFYTIFSFLDACSVYVRHKYKNLITVTESKLTLLPT